MRLADRRIVVCVGSGGVGKTTTAAALAVEAAWQGRRTAVVTVDPARRLADALGLDDGAVGNRPTPIDGSWPGELWAVMLDAERTFDDLVVAYAADPAQAERILTNRFYRNIAGALSGTQEYMAAEKLFELQASRAFDVVIVDTPPTRHALDFLGAPRRLAAFLDHPLYRALRTPARGYLRTVNAAARRLVGAIGGVVGAEALEDGLTFFAAFEGMEEGFRNRSAGVDALLTDPATAYVVVTAPRPDAVADAGFFVDHLAARAVPVAALVVNRVQPRFGSASAEVAARRAVELAATPLAGLARNLAGLTALAEDEEARLAELLTRVAAPVARVPLLPHDIHDLATLDEVRRHLAGL